MAVIKNQTPIKADPNKIVSGIQEAAANYNQQDEQRKKVAADFSQQYWPSLTPNLPEIRQSTVNNEKWSPYIANRIEETIWWNNYYLPNGQLTTQGQYNSLNWTGHVAWIPQWPQTLQPDYSQMQSTWAYEWNTTPQAQPTTPKWNWGTKQPSVSTPQNEVSEQPASDIENWQTPDSWKKQEEEQPANNMNEQALADMQADLGWDNTWMLYGKVTADANWGSGIQTVADPYNVEKATNEARIANLRKLQWVDSKDIADSIASWDGVPYGEQALRDLMQYNPEKYAEVQQYIKEYKWQLAINGITSGDMSWISATQTTVDNINNWVDSWADGISSNAQQAWQFINNITNAMGNNWAALTASQEMRNISSQMDDIKKKLANVKKEAAASFKWDVPQYMVDARAANLAQQYQAALDKLEGRFNTAATLYKTELAHEEFKEEMQFKYAQRQDSINNENWNRYYKMQQLQQDSIKRVNWTAYKLDVATGTYRQLSDESAKYSYTNKVNEMMKWWNSIYQDWWWYWAQCEAFTDNFVQATTWLRMTWQRSDWATTAEEKRSYVNTLTPEVWSVVVAIWWAYDSQRWHTMLITWYDPTTWLIDLTWANTNWDLKIHKSTTTLADIQRNAQRVGIRNPYDDIVNSSQVQWWTWTYSYYAWPMQSFFEEAYEKATVASERADIKAAQDSYAIMNELVDTWTIDKIANSDEFNVLLSEISNGKFTDSSWNVNFDKITKYIRNELKDEDIAYWMDRLRRLIEKKLRKESWAAISMSEWNSNFDMYLPNVWQSPEYRYKRLQALERDIVAEQLPPKYRANYIPLIWNSTVREIR